MSAFAQAQQTIAEMRAQISPELKGRIIVFAVVSLALGLLAVLLLVLFGATYEPLTWTLLMLTGAAYGWFAHSELTSGPRQPIPQQKASVTPWNNDDDEEEAE